MLLTVTLPWPDRLLHPNARTHWGRKAGATKAAREMAMALALQAGWRRALVPEGRLDLWVDFYPPDRRRRDDDGMLASFKAARDGLAQALGIDDSRFYSHPRLLDEVRPGGEICVRITAAGDRP